MDFLSHRPRRSEWIWILLAVLPFWSIYLIHFHCLGSSATGFVQTDQAYYMANARGIFERGNGLSYPNPFDSDPHSPSIYFQWPIWISGALIKIFGWDPGYYYIALGLFASLVFSLFSWEIMGSFVREKRLRPLCFLFLLWGGGIFTIAAFATQLWKGNSSLDPLIYDPFRGYWFQNWGRNLIYSYETVYHALVLGVWISVLKRKWNTALSFTLATLGAHPFTGCSLIAGLLIWLLAQRLVFPAEKIPRRFLIGLGISILCFLSYYFVFLPSFPSYREIMRQCALPFTMNLYQNGLALLPVAALAAYGMFRSWSAPGGFSRRELLFVCFFATSFLLSNHQWLIKPTEPLHFTRGYVWFPLAVLSLSTIERLLTRTAQRFEATHFPFGIGIAASTVLLVIASADNLGFLTENSRTCEEHMALPKDVREIFREADRAGLSGVLFSPIPRVCVLSPTYSRLIPYCAHMFLTPNAMDRVKAITKSLQSHEPGEWLKNVNYLLLEREDDVSWLHPSDWEPLLRRGNYLFLRRKSLSSQQSPL